ncbi:putative SOS response-associated peptidase YedK [Lutibacter oceani]|uniref:Abasic site processing protein n=1 Tax=Lutibacter oceani TaxID=1853311 RepID=A0A3D9RS24_9FLAO|nr:SOS response-associated peptidase family protein [Lutibacter oceani]REE80314.1 putative SOS response-associated peptidase YedK [Lutibacter oceani]
MCFHTSHTKKVKKVENRFKVQLIDDALRETYDTPHFHNNGFEHLNSLIIPQQKATHLIPATWGIVPPAKKVSEIKEYYKQQLKYGSGLNARSEKLFDYWLYEKSAFTKRCIIPVSGFFEPHEYNKQKYPIHIKQKDDDLMGLAGIYTVVENIVTYTILTKTASPLFAKIHNKKLRQPVILSQHLETDWMNGSLSENEVKELLNIPFDDTKIEAFAVSKDLFNSRIDSNTATILQEDTSILLHF